MFDWPEQSQTSPRTTFSSSTVSGPVETRTWNSWPSAFGVESLTIQWPSASAWAFASVGGFPVAAPQFAVTVTVSPGFALPQIGTLASCCITIPLERTAGSFSSAPAKPMRVMEGRSAATVRAPGRRDGIIFMG